MPLAHPADAPGPDVSVGGTPRALSDQLEAWLTGDGEKTVGGLVDAFGEKSFALLFLLLLAVPALPLPTGGLTHIFEIIAALLALEMIVGRWEIWLPERWRRLELAGDRQQRLVAGLMKLIRWFERWSRPRLRFLFHHRLSDVVYSLLVIAGSAAAFVAPPFSGLDTLPALGVVVLSLGVLLEDFAIATVGVLLAAVGIVLEIALGTAAVHGISSLL
ncbi:MAG TPA: exopolysaccharide biosynthesis protein [Solirubrobacteraceae bacterium]|nr:exopolysaccharide biosynthesis protein [Solirubrobacteraceae bacterium]